MAQNAKYLYADQCLALVKSESTAGVDASPTPADNAIVFKSLTITPTIEFIDLERIGPTFRSPGGVPSKGFCDVQFDVPMANPWADTTLESVREPDFTPLLRASLFDTTSTTDTDSWVCALFAGLASRCPYYNLTDGDELEIDVDEASSPTTVTFNTADFADINYATPAEIAAVINGESITNVTAGVSRGRLYIARDSPTGSSDAIQVSGGSANTELGFDTSVLNAYNPVTAWTAVPDSKVAQNTCTVYCYMFPPGAETNDEAYLVKSFGCVFNLEIMANEGEEAVFRFTGKGNYQTVADTTYPSGAVYYGEQDAMAPVGAQVTWDDLSGSEARTDTFLNMSINMNWDVQERGDKNQELGIRSFFLTRKGSATGSYDPEATLADEYDRWADVLAATQHALLAIFESPQNGVCTIRAGNVQYGSPGFNLDGRVMHEQSFYLRDCNYLGDNYIEIEFSAGTP